MVDVLFVCLGNICRSPMAEAVFSRLVDEAGLTDSFTIGSAGTGDWHVGEPAHRGTRRVLRDHGIEFVGRAKQVRAADIRPDTYLIAMDSDNLRELRRRFGAHPRLRLLLDYAPDAGVRDVPDPYYAGNFEEVYQLVRAGCEGLLAAVVREMELKPAQVTGQDRQG